MANDLGIRIGLEGLAQYQAGISQAERSTGASMGRISSAFASTNASFRELAGQIPGLGAAFSLITSPAGVALASVTGLVAGMKDFVTVAAQFESQLATVGALLGIDRTTEAFQALNDEAQRLGATTEFSATQAGQAMEQLATAGFNAEQTLAGTKDVLALATVGGLDLARAAEVAANTLNQFQLPVSELSSVVDVISKVSITAATNVQQFADAMNFLGPSAAALGIPIEEASAAVGVLSNAGLRGSLATQALGTALINLTRPTAQAQAALDRLSIAPFVNGEFVGLAGLIRQLETSFKGLTAEQRQNAIATIFGAEAVQEINILIGKGADEIEKYTAEIEAAGAQNGKFSEEIRRIKLDTFQGAIVELESAWEGLKIELVDGALPALKELTQGLSTGVQGVTEFLAGSSSLAGVLEDNAEYLALAAGAIVVYNQAAILAGAKAIPALVTSILSSAKAFGLQAAASRVSIAAQALYITGSNLLSGSITLATAAQRVFNVVFAANPIGLIATALSVAAAAYFAFGREAKKTAEVQKDFAAIQGQIAEAYTTERIALDRLFAPLRSTTASQKERAAAIKEINAQYGEYLPGLLTEKSSAEDLAIAYRAANKAIIDGIVARTVSAETERVLGDILKAQIKGAQDAAAAQKRLNEEREEFARLGIDPAAVGDISGVFRAEAENATRVLEDELSAIEQVAKTAGETLLNSLGEINFASLITGTEGATDKLGGVTDKAKTLSSQLKELGVSLEALNRFNDISNLERALPLGSIASAAERARDAITNFAIQPGTSLSELQKRLSDVQSALQLIDPGSAGFAELAGLAGDLEARLSLVRSRLENLTNGIDPDPIVIPVEIGSVTVPESRIDLPELTLRAGVELPPSAFRGLSSLSEAAEILGLDVEFVNQRFSDTGELLAALDSGAVKFGQALSGSLQGGIEFADGLKAALENIQSSVLQGLTTSLQGLGVDLASAIKSGPALAVQDLEQQLQAVNAALQSTVEGSAEFTALNAQKEAIEQQIGAVDDLRAQLAGLNSAIANLPQGSPAFEAMSRQAKTVEDQLARLEGRTSRAGQIFGDFAREVLAMVLQEGARIAGVYLMQYSLALGPAGIPVFLAGAALAGLSGFLPELLLKDAEENGFLPSTPTPTFTGGGGGAAGPQLATGQTATVGLSDFAGSSTPVVNVRVQFDGQDVTDAFSIFFQTEKELTG